MAEVSARTEGEVGERVRRRDRTSMPAEGSEEWAISQRGVSGQREAQQRM